MQITPLLSLLLLSSVAQAMPTPPMYYVGGEQWEPTSKAELPEDVAKAVETIRMSGKRGNYGLTSVMIFKRSRMGLYPWDPASVEVAHLTSLLKFAQQHFTGLGERVFPPRAKKLFLTEMEVFNNMKSATLKDVVLEFTPTIEDPAGNSKALHVIGRFVQEKLFAGPEQQPLEVLISEASFDETLEREPSLYIGERWGVALLRRHKTTPQIRKQQMAGTTGESVNGS